MSRRNYETLDAIVVVAALLMVTGLGAGLLLLEDIPGEHLPIIASLTTAILGLPVTYGAFRWGNTVGGRQAAEAAAETSRAATGALAALAAVTPAATAGGEPDGP